MSDPSLHAGRNVLVTGASRGIGYAVAKAFAERGAHVIALARTQGGLEELDDEITAGGGRCSLIVADLTDRDLIRKLPEALAERFGRLDVFVANAGVLGDLSPVTDILPKVWDNAFEVNVTANRELLAGLDPLLRASDAGRVIGISSGRAHKYKAFWATYSATKAAFEALLKTYADEMAETKVRTNIIDPGATRTGMRAKAMPGEDPMSIKGPDALNSLILDLSSPEETRNGEVVVYGR